MAEMRCFFSLLVDGSATEVQPQISGRGRTDQRRQNNAFLGMIHKGNTTLLLACAGELINGRVTTLLLSAD